MDERERYLVVMMDGTCSMVLAYTFHQVLDLVGDDDVLQITKMEYEEIREWNYLTKFTIS